MRTITGEAPLSHVSVRYRSSRRRFRSSLSDVTTKTTSTLATSTCSSVACQAVLRENFVRRERTAWIVPPVSSVCVATATQSPTTGSSAVSSASCLRRPATSTRSSPASVKTSQAPRCCTATLPGTSPAARCGSNSSRSRSSQPSFVSVSNVSILPVSVHESGRGGAHARTRGAQDPWRCRSACPASPGALRLAGLRRQARRTRSRTSVAPPSSSGRSEYAGFGACAKRTASARQRLRPRRRRLFRELRAAGGSALVLRQRVCESVSE